MQDKARRWLEQDPDPDTQAELEKLILDNATLELEDRFGCRLAFGTAGLRGVLGAGSNRMNRLVIRQTSAGLGKYLLEQVEDAASRGVVVGYDGRHKSEVFALDTALVMAGLGIRVHLYNVRVPTPLVPYAIGELGAAAGVVVTASHNPPQYNGYKVFWENGSQIIPPHDSGIAASIERAALVRLPWCEPEKARDDGLLVTLGDEIIAKYVERVLALSLHPQSSARASLRIAYTPMHGVGAHIAEEVMRRAGFGQVHTVTEQREPDPNFSTVQFPNPEEPGASDLVWALAKKIGATLACANDPDADRFSVSVKTGSGELRQLNGDQIGAILGADFLDHAPDNAVVGNSVVSSRLLGVIAAARGVNHFTTLTGLKWIADAALQHEAKGEEFIYGYEESIGYMFGALVRDKDGIAALLCFCTLAADLADRGKTVWSYLESIYREHGLYLTRLQTKWLTVTGKGPSAGELLRQSPPSTIAGHKVTCVTDVLTGIHGFADGRRKPVELPKSDVLIYTLEDDTRVIVRPSGTEPKLKCYYEIHGMIGDDESLDLADARGQRLLDDLVAAHQQELAGLSN
ncbi:MAG: phosphoglucomutase [Deltaproteobacteria bacterium RIFOXYA12_FULL_58_15]|nr:MAG: phosphoglucomutase [Deltaproteobacteria bacterium RIFOXYA12_FULL_58_15]OGR08142.1 MAG: phosphoglucomutase [Deltaproteobacteria bacterium RIFOXYB12_FULL_58_9]